MLSEEDKRRIEAEETYRAQMRGGGKAPSQLGIGMKREAGSIIFRLVGLAVILLVALVACTVMSIK